LPKANERLEIQSGKKTLVLLRIICESEYGTSIEPFKHIVPADNINIGLAVSFLLGGNVNRLSPRFLSPETRKKGWVFFLIPPGEHFFVFQGPQHTDVWTWEKQMRYRPRWQANIPHNAAIVYIGTMHLHCTFSYELFGESQTTVLNEESLAINIVEEYLKGLGSFQTILMK
jgi:hypothetical protein